MTDGFALPGFSYLPFPTQPVEIRLLSKLLYKHCFPNGHSEPLFTVFFQCPIFNLFNFSVFKINLVIYTLDKERQLTGLLKLRSDSATYCLANLRQAIGTFFDTCCSPASLNFAKCWDLVFCSVNSCSLHLPLIRAIVAIYCETTPPWDLYYALSKMSQLSPQNQCPQHGVEPFTFWANFPPRCSAAIHPKIKPKMLSLTLGLFHLL